MLLPPSLAIGHRVARTSAEGPFTRYALWTAGCTLRCPGCCNPHLFETSAGRSMTVAALIDEIEQSRLVHGIEGVSLLGGEPLQQITPLIELCQALQARDLGVLLFTGYSREEAEAIPDFGTLWSSLDTMIDGRYRARERELPSSAGGRRFIGSQNQRLWHRTSRYEADELWRGPQRLEIHIAHNGTLSAHGDPRAVAGWLDDWRRTQTIV